MIIAGDIHGQVRLMEKVLKSFENNKILFVGDIIDRGDAKSCLKLLSESGAKSLIGNHEQMAIAFCNAPEADLKSFYNIWMANGGLSTLKSFGIKNKDLKSVQILVQTNALFDSIRCFDIYKIIDDMIIIHAGIDRNYLFDPYESFVWSRTPIDEVGSSVMLSFKNNFPAIKFMITGHNIVKTPAIYTNRSILQLRIDLGSFYSKTVGVFDTESKDIYKISKNDLLLVGNIKSAANSRSFFG